MLVLSRNLGESIRIGDTILFTVLDNKRKKQIKIGIEAPKDVAIYREELYQKIKSKKS